MRELLRAEHDDEGIVSVTVFPFADKKRTEILANTVLDALVRTFGVAGLRRLRQQAGDHRELLRAFMNDEWQPEVVLSYDSRDKPVQRRLDKLAQTVVEAIMRVFGEDVLREFRILNAVKSTRPS